MKTILFAVGGSLFAIVSHVSATAQSADSIIVTDINVRYGDLDLTSKPGAETMLARLDKAAAKACGRKPMSAMSWDAMAQARAHEHRRCKAAAIENATMKLGAPLVRAAWLRRTKAIQSAAETR
ncbi:UrcA family protein [Sphingomonas sp. DT-204]|uniref:UrcA family protein n=1 Tax=Sphingomonas sp. DT-204 TaxID=3396166 RepID=UPI003F1B7C48